MSDERYFDAPMRTSLANNPGPRPTTNTQANRAETAHRVLCWIEHPFLRKRKGQYRRGSIHTVEHRAGRQDYWRALTFVV